MTTSNNGVGLVTWKQRGAPAGGGRLAPLDTKSFKNWLWCRRLEAGRRVGTAAGRYHVGSCLGWIRLPVGESSSCSSSESGGVASCSSSAGIPSSSMSSHGADRNRMSTTAGSGSEGSRESSNINYSPKGGRKFHCYGEQLSLPQNHNRNTSHTSRQFVVTCILNKLKYVGYSTLVRELYAYV
jgi:hypothetical protein